MKRALATKTYMGSLTATDAATVTDLAVPCG